MRDELYIDGIKCDMGTSDISLEYRSNILTDIKKVVSNFSYTVKLPKTAHNLSLIECAHIPSAVCQFPYLAHKGMVIRDGVQIISNANVAVIGVSDSIEVALNWGNATAFLLVVEYDGTLNELNYDVDTDFIPWNDTFNTPSSEGLNINYGVSGKPLRPCKRVVDVIKQIEKQFKVELFFPDDVNNELTQLYIPLLTTNPSEKIDIKNNISIPVSGVFENQKILYSLANNELVNTISPIGGGYSGISPRYPNVMLNVHINLALRVRLSSPLDISLILAKSNGGEDVIPYATIEEVPGGGSKRERIYRYNYNIEVDPGVSFELRIKGLVSFAIPEGMFNNISVEPHHELWFGNNVFNRFYYTINLPEIKPIDFLKNIAYLLGLFAVPESDNAVKFVSFDEVLKGKRYAADWSDRLLSNTTESSNISFSLKDFAQKNWFRWKEDETVQGSYDGNITVDSQVIEYEREAVEMKFAACDTDYQGRAIIPIYTPDNPDGTRKVQPRIVMKDVVKGVFEPLRWNEVLRRHYSTYKDAVNRPRVIKELFRLSAADLSTLDLLKPIYLAQHGSFYAIIKAKTKKDNICEVELLKI